MQVFKRNTCFWICPGTVNQTPNLFHTSMFCTALRCLPIIHPRSARPILVFQFIRSFLFCWLMNSQSCCPTCQWCSPVRIKLLQCLTPAFSFICPSSNGSSQQKSLIKITDGLSQGGRLLNPHPHAGVWQNRVSHTTDILLFRFRC